MKKLFLNIFLFFFIFLPNSVFSITEVTKFKMECRMESTSYERSRITENAVINYEKQDRIGAEVKKINIIYFIKIKNENEIIATKSLPDMFYDYLRIDLELNTIDYFWISKSNPDLKGRINAYHHKHSGKCYRI